MNAINAQLPPSYAYTMEEPLVVIEGLAVHYDSPILRDVNLTIQNIVRPGHTQGQVVGLLAPSGMGKSQLFRCISGIKKPDHGTVHINRAVTGETRELVPVRAGMVGVVAQDYPLFNHLTVFDNILMATRLKVRDKKQAREIAITMLERFGMSERRDLYPHQISGGQRQRVAIIQQVVCTGNLLLMDEPFSGLDPLLKEGVQAMIGSLAASDEHNTIILTTHDISAAIATCDTIMLLGRERDATGTILPGANVRFVYNLIDMGLTWRPEIESLPQFHDLETEIRARFHEL